MRDIVRLLKKFVETGYIDYKITNNTIQDISLLRFGNLLSKNLISEWYKDEATKNFTSISNTGTIDLQVHKANPATYLDNILPKEFWNIKKFKKNTNNFAVKQTLQFKNKPEPISNEFNINLHRGTLVTCDYLFVNKTVAAEHFHKIQRERKIWWMRLSFNPGRFTFCDFKSNTMDNYKAQSVSIKSKFNFGDIHFEDIKMIPLKPFILDKFGEFSLKDSRLKKSFYPVAAIHTEFCLEEAILGLLMDATEKPDVRRISLNRKIAPYQCNIFYITKEDNNTEIDTLKDLAKHISEVITIYGITIYKIEHVEQNHLDDKLIQMDDIGIPYAIILYADSLLTGIMKLRNRDTTVSELIHITDVLKYLQKIFQNGINNELPEI